MTRPGYTLDNTWDKSHRRLTCLERAYDEGTFARLTQLGVGPGWRCLELGAGAGSVARWLAETVGPSGQVTAVDLEPRLLLADPRPNLEVLRHDIVADGIPGECWDLIHTRALLMHVSGRDALLEQIVSRLRPGGVVLLEEADCYPTATASSASYARLWEQSAALAAKAGGDWFWARSLPARLIGAGAQAVTARSDVHYFRSGDAWAEFLDLTWEQLTPALLAEGVDAGLIATVRAELFDPAPWFPAAAMIAVAGRAPLSA